MKNHVYYKLTVVKFEALIIHDEVPYNGHSPLFQNKP